MGHFEFIDKSGEKHRRMLTKPTVSGMAGVLDIAENATNPDQQAVAIVIEMETACAYMVLETREDLDRYVLELQRLGDHVFGKPKGH